MKNKIPSTFKRLLSRAIDYVLIYFVIKTLVSLTSIPVTELTKTFLAIFTVILGVPLETLSIMGTKSTPGKALLGLEVSCEDGSRPSFKEALKHALLPYPKKPRNVRLKEKVGRKLRAQIIAIIFSVSCLGSAAIVEYFSEPISVIAMSQNTSWNWKPFKVPEKEVKIDMPQKPTVVEKQLDLPKGNKPLTYKEYIDEHPNEGVNFSISYTELPKSLMKWSSSLILKGSFKIIVSNQKGATVLEKSSSKYKSHPALDYHVSIGDNHSRGRLVLIDNVLYKLDVTYPNTQNEAIDPSVSNFLESFKP